MQPVKEVEITMSDWHTQDGKRSLKIGKEIERDVVSSFGEKGYTTDHIAEDPKRFFDGYDVLVEGKRVEIKSNSGVDDWGNPYRTFCVETVTKVGKPIGWSTGLSDAVVLVNIRTRTAYFYNARKLAAWSVHQQTFISNGALCFKMPHECTPAGYLHKWELL
jgi:hypothetical protein